MLLWTVIYRYMFESLLPVLQSVYLELELLDCVIIICLIFWRTTKICSTEAVPEDRIFRRYSLKRKGTLELAFSLHWCLLFGALSFSQFTFNVIIDIVRLKCTISEFVFTCSFVFVSSFLSPFLMFCWSILTNKQGFR